MPSDWPTEEQKKQWQRLSDAVEDARDECAGLRGKARMACRAKVTGELASKDEE